MKSMKREAVGPMPSDAAMLVNIRGLGRETEG